jgi:hypothetical protein
MRKGTAKQKRSVSRGAGSQLNLEKITAGGRMLEHRSVGNSWRMPAMTKNMPVSNRTEIKCNSISPVATGNLSQLSSCMNGEKTAISTIRIRTILGNLCIGRPKNYSCRGKSRGQSSLGNWGEYNIQFLVYKVLGQVVAFPSGCKIHVNH